MIAIYNFIAGKSSTWCRNAVSYDEMKDIEDVWLRDQAEFLPQFIDIWLFGCFVS